MKQHQYQMEMQRYFIQHPIDIEQELRDVLDRDSEEDIVEGRLCLSYNIFSSWEDLVKRIAFNCHITLSNFERSGWLNKETYCDVTGTRKNIDLFMDHINYLLKEKE